MPHRPRKRFGQHFLHDPEVIRRIVAAIAPQPGQRLVEIGPGEGALTRALLAHSDRLDAVELDRDLAAGLAATLGDPPGLVVHSGDALRFDYRGLAAGDRLRVAGNLPYNISTPLLFHLFSQADAIADMHFMLQREVVERMAAAPGSKTYGRLSVMTRARCTVETLFTVGPDAFRPPPKVESAVVRLVPQPLAADRAALLPALETVVRQAFGQRRKTLRNSLKGSLEANAIRTADIDPGMRPEQLGLEAFWRLAALLPDPEVRNQPQ